MKEPTQINIQICACEKSTKFMREIVMKLSELLKANESVKNQLNKVETEIVSRLAELQAAVVRLTADLEDATLTAEQEQSVLDVQAAAQKLDDIIPDAEPKPAA